MINVLHYIESTTRYATSSKQQQQQNIDFTTTTGSEHKSDQNTRQTSYNESWWLSLKQDNNYYRTITIFTIITIKTKIKCLFICQITYTMSVHLKLSSQPFPKNLEVETGMQIIVSIIICLRVTQTCLAPHLES